MAKQSAAARAATMRPWGIAKARPKVDGHSTWHIGTTHKHTTDGLLCNAGWPVATCYGPDAEANAWLLIRALRAYEEGE